jgi:signal transduction histidine kinase
VRRHLFLQIYVAFVGVLLGCVLAVGLVAHALREDATRDTPVPLSILARLATDDLPDHSPEAFQQALEARAARLEVELTVWGADGELVATTGTPIAPPEDGDKAHRWVHRRGRAAIQVRLDDGRWLSAALPPRAGDHYQRFLAFLALLALVIAAGSLPLARRITRRLRQLQDGVEQLGAGDLSARVEVCGRDEVARLAEAFNMAAERIEGLVERQRRVLASASHELRSPLARIRMTLGLLESDDAERQEFVDGAIRDTSELDELIGHLLLTARLEATGPLVGPLPVELLELARAEAERTGAEVLGEPVTVAGDPTMLGLMLRNLLENARRYGGEAAARVVVARRQDVVELAVEDEGPGIREPERERIFEPFYRPAGHREGAHGGVGLGLALAREIARHHGGDVVYRPREGGGSRFVVTLPA